MILNSFLGESIFFKQRTVFVTSEFSKFCSFAERQTIADILKLGRPNFNMNSIYGKSHDPIHIHYYTQAQQRRTGLICDKRYRTHTISGMPMSDLREKCRCRTTFSQISGIYKIFKHHTASSAPGAAVYGLAGCMDVVGVSLSTVRSLDVEGLSLSSLHLRVMIDQSVWNYNMHLLDGTSHDTVQYSIPACIPANLYTVNYSIYL